jgi:hypothetical protein
LEQSIGQTLDQGVQNLYTQKQAEPEAYPVESDDQEFEQKLLDMQSVIDAEY